jgi:hypothetical protein
MRVLRKEKFTILFEPDEQITGILICDNNSIELRRKLHTIVDLFKLEYGEKLQSKMFIEGYLEELNIIKICEMLESNV